jgi:hypothetical protein
MKAARPTTLTFTVLSCALLLPLVAGACGSEAEPPIITTGGQATGGSSQSTSGSGGAGVIPMGGSGVTPTGGSGGSAIAGTAQGGTGIVTGGTGGTGTGGAAGGMAGGTSGGMGGASGTAAGGSSAGMPGDLKETVGGPLTGQMLKGPCLSDFDPLVCRTGDGCQDNNADFALSGVLTTDNTITLGGDPAKLYNITLHIQGEVEAKSYGSAGDQEKSKPSPMADGFQVGGSPTKADAYNVYMARVVSPAKDYFFNALVPPGVSDHTTYGIDYVGKIQANGGSKIRLIAADRNCSMIKNCGPNNNGNGCSAPITLANIDPVAKSKNPTFDFTKAYNGQWVVMVVTDVTVAN